MGLGDKGFHREAAHLAQQQADQQLPSRKPLYFGYISSVDIDKGLVRVVNPINANDIDMPLESGFMPLGVFMVGLPSFQGKNQNPLDHTIEMWGFQYAPFGGQEVSKDIKGEQVLVCQISSEIGYSLCAHLVYNELALPPGKSVPVEKVKIKNGEWCQVSPTGTFIWSDVKGNIRIYVQQPQGGEDDTPPDYAPGEDNEDHGNLEAVVNGGVCIQTAPRDTKITAPLQGDINALADYSINGVATLGGIEFTAGFEGEYIEPEPGDINLLAEDNITETALLGVSITAGLDTAVIPLEGEIILTADVDITNLAGTFIDSEAGTSITETAGTSIDMTAGTAASLIAGTDIDVSAGALITILATGTIEIQSVSNVNILAPLVNIGAQGESLLTLMTAAFAAYLATHTHPAPGGVTGPPNGFPLLVYPFMTESLAAG